MTRSFLVVLGLTLAALAGPSLGCGKRDREPPSSSAVAAAPQALQAGGQAPADRPLERAMRITIETYITVGDVEGAMRAVRELTARSGGYVGEAHVSGVGGAGDGSRSASIEVHVPVAALPAFRSGVAGLGEVTNDSEKAEDVTEQRADIRARLGSSRAEEKRLLELLEKQTGSLADVVAVEKELARVRETIERMEAQERVLEGQIALATVKITLSTKSIPLNPGSGTRIARAFGEGIENAGSFLVGTAVFLGSAGPTLLILAAFGYLVFRGVRFVARRSKAEK